MSSPVVLCRECGKAKVHIDEPLESGYVGTLCVNDDCPVDA